MKKSLCVLLIATLAITTGLAVYPDQVQAASGKGSTAEKVFLDKQQAKKDKKEKYKSGEAIVLLDGNTASTKPKAATVMGLKGDLKVADLWTFDDVPQKKASKASNGITSDQSVALVKSSTLSTPQLVKTLKQNKNVLKAEPNYICKAATLPNDPYIGKQWAIKNTGQNGGTAGNDIKAESMWDKGRKGTESVVAVIDTGVDYTHEDLSGNMWKNTKQAKLSGKHGFDFVNGDDDPMDDYGHGTHCAGIIGATGNNQKGISGVNQSAKIMALKFLDDEGSGYISDAIAAYSYINKAISIGVPVTAINNSWGGEGDDSEIFAVAMDAVGVKGAVSVCAAGNESIDIDKNDDYTPAAVKSDYKVSVAATGDKNQLANFSNYGEETIDLAAPGTNILSTVSYNSFNPSIYDAKPDRLCSNFASYEKDAISDVTWGVPEATAIHTNGNAEMETSLDASAFFGDNGKSLKLKITEAEEAEFISIELPYEINTTSEDTYISGMVKTSGPKAEMVSTPWGEMLIPTYFNITDVPASKQVRDSDTLESLNYDFVYVDGKSDSWEHLQFKGSAKKDTGGTQQRKLVFVLECNVDSDEDYEINIDDLGISKENVSADQFGKYDFYDGTSMAAPYVTGAAALINETAKCATADELVERLETSVTKTASLNGKVRTGGVLDLSRADMAAAPKVSDASVDVSTGKITLMGKGFVAGTKVKMGDTQVSSADISIKSANQIVINDKGWINKIVNITVSNKNGSNTKKNVYLVKGKTAYTKIKNSYMSVIPNAVGTNGGALLAADSEDGKLYKYVPSTKKFSSLLSVKVKELFKIDASKLGEEEFRFGRDLAYADGKIYNIASLAAIAEEDYEDEGDYGEEGEEDEDDDSFEWLLEEPLKFAADSKLIVMNPSNKKTASIDLPKEYDNISNPTVASYNGKLYLIGGYDHGDESGELSKLVKVYDPATKKWSAGPSLPSGRAAGKALQVGNSLVYTLGYSANDTCPKNLIFNGTTWKTSTSTIKPFESTSQKVQGKEYKLFSGSVGLCADGLLYAGMPTDGLGDTFTYSISKDTFAATKYNHILKLETGLFIGSVVGSTLYGTNEDGNMMKVSGLKSGLVKATAKKSNYGTVQGANKAVLPGQKVTLKAVPKTGYKVKSFKVAGKTIKGTSTTVRLTKNQTVSVTFVKK